MTRLNEETFATYLTMVLSNPSSGDAQGLMKVMENLCEECGKKLGEPKFGLHAALKYAFGTSSIPTSVRLAIEINPNNAKQMFHAAKMKILKAKGCVSDYQRTKLRNDFLRLARELDELGILKEAVDTIYQSNDI